MSIGGDDDDGDGDGDDDDDDGDGDATRPGAEAATDRLDVLMNICSVHGVGHSRQPSGAPSAGVQPPGRDRVLERGKLAVRVSGEPDRPCGAHFEGVIGAIGGGVVSFVVVVVCTTCVPSGLSVRVSLTSDLLRSPVAFSVLVCVRVVVVDVAGLVAHAAVNSAPETRSAAPADAMKFVMQSLCAIPSPGAQVCARATGCASGVVERLTARD
jgi:hypothetical protein